LHFRFAHPKVGLTSQSSVYPSDLETVRKQFTSPSKTHQNQDRPVFETPTIGVAGNGKNPISSGGYVMGNTSKNFTRWVLDILFRCTTTSAEYSSIWCSSDQSTRAAKWSRHPFPIGIASRTKKLL